jgi:hypothetical protein
MKIGIGVTTYNRPDVIADWLGFFELYRPENCILDIQDDTIQRKGVAARKNDNLRALKDCDVIFLFDDDCYPIKEGWHNFFIDIWKQTKVSHFVYNVDEFHRIIGYESLFKITEGTGGVFLFLTNDVVKSIGAFNEEFGNYGFEHAEYSYRIHKAGFSPYPYMTPIGIEEYIFANDYNVKNFKSSVTNEEKVIAVRENFHKFEALRKNPIIYREL